jgi:hypothetical protein
VVAVSFFVVKASHQMARDTYVILTST